ncbi:MAG: hypothetical protein BWX65_00551 [Bacteroidetes bacterium ADurb.Bin057]|nr:MAG: hypothetical protein BWX65_00551 [Bacteroidetes bacterium ADurb.Bin057]
MPAVSGDKYTGKKATIAIDVAPNNAIAVFFAVLNSAVFTGFPNCKSTIMPSITTIALSTNIPIATINAPSDMRWSVPSKASSTGKVVKTVRTSPEPMITPLLKPMVNISTSITMTTETTKFNIKSLIAVCTFSG